jgi:hypothetical protein
MTAIWPTELPELPERDGWSETFPKNGVRTQNDVGQAKQRRRFTAGVRPHTITLILTQEQTVIFDTFWSVDCGEGALPFTWVNGRTGDTVDFQFNVNEPPVITNKGGSTYICRFPLEQLP